MEASSGSAGEPPATKPSADTVISPAWPPPPPPGAPRQAAPPSRAPHRAVAPPPPGAPRQAVPPSRRRPRWWWWIAGGAVAAGLAGAFAASSAFDEQLGIDVGDCFPEELPTDQNGEKLDTVPCSEPHKSEVFALVRDRAGDAEPYPGDAEMMRRSAQGCVDAFPAYVGTTASKAVLEFMTVWPSEGSWEQENDRLSICLLLAVEGLLVGSKRGKAPDRPLPAERSVVSLTVGDCFNSERMSAGGAIAAVELVDCAMPHTFEVIAMADAPSDIDYEEIDGFAERSCDRLFESYVGVPFDSSVLTYYWIVPLADDWNIVGDRRSFCIAADDSRDLVGTVRNTKR
jgi:hypothetical protein